jgi:hypothetical protein
MNPLLPRRPPRIAAGLAALAVCLPLSAGIPQVSWILYGQALDSYGWPFVDDATVELRVAGRFFNRYAIRGSVAPGVNFVFHVPMDSGSGTRYDPAAALPGEPFEIILVTGNASRTLVPASDLPPIGRPGEIRRVNVTTGTNADEDGLPDEWEQWILDRSRDPRIATLPDVRTQDDFDADGMTNLEEYQAGTDPTSAADYFYIDRVTRVAGDRIGITFLTVPGKTYRLSVAPPPGSSDLRNWQPATYAPNPTEGFRTGPIEGSGFFVTVFLAAANPAEVFRLQVE